MIFGMRVWLQPDKLAALNLTPADVVAALTEQNLYIAAGTIGGSPQPNVQTFEYSVLTNSRINTREQFEKYYSSHKTGRWKYSLFKKDVARVQLGKFDYSINSYVNGKPAAFILIYLAPGANALDTYKGINDALNNMRKNFPKDVDYLVPLETASVVQASIKEVVDTLVIALILVIIVVFLFLQNWRATLIPVLAIPVSLIGTFIFFIPFGFTINTLTLFAFVLAIGIVVDDAIVVVEAVQHYIDHEKISPKEATQKAMKDISGPVVAIALILAAVFVPVGFVPGIVGRLYQQFAITIAVSVIISAFVALSLTPALCSLMLRPAKDENAKKNFLDKFYASFNRGFDKLSHGYTRSVAKWIRFTPLVLIMMVVLFVGLFFLFKSKPTGFIPTEDEGRLYVTYEMPEGTSTTRNVEMLKQIMAKVQSNPAVNVVGGLAGLNIINFAIKSNSGTMFVQLKPWDDRKSKKRTNRQCSGANNPKHSRSTRSKSLSNKNHLLFQVLGKLQVSHSSCSKLPAQIVFSNSKKIAQKFLGALYQRPEIGLAYTFFSTKTPSYEIDVDREKAKKLGVSVADVYTTMSTLMGSSYVNDFNLYGRNFRVMAMADTSYRASLDDLQSYYVRNQQGQMVPLNSLVTSKLIEKSCSGFSLQYLSLYRN